MSETSMQILRKVRSHPTTVGESNVWEEIYKQYKPPVDVNSRLAAMGYGNGEENSIHQTQRAVTASMLNNGDEIADIVSLVYDATKLAVSAEYSQNWNWDKERKKIEKMCATWVAKLAKEDAPKPVTKPKLKLVTKDGARGFVDIGRLHHAGERFLQAFHLADGQSELLADAAVSGGVAQHRLGAGGGR